MQMDCPSGHNVASCSGTRSTKRVEDGLWDGLHAAVRISSRLSLIGDDDRGRYRRTGMKWGINRLEWTGVEMCDDGRGESSG